MAKLQLLFTTLLLAFLCSEAQQFGKAIMHFGNCNSAEFGRGTCIEKKDCDFYAVDKLTDFASKQQCFSRQRPDLVCCPRETNIIPPLGPRIANDTTAGGVNTSSSTHIVPSTSTPLRLVARTTPRPPTGVDQLPQHPYCGSAFSFRVVGGVNTGLFEFPWTTLLEYELLGGGKDFACGASFIAQRWLLTAAHCIQTPGRNLTAAVLGEWNQDTDPDCENNLSGVRECAPPHIRVTIDRILPHAQYSDKTYVNDIALLRLSRPVNWLQMQYLEPVCLPPQRGKLANRLVGSAADVSGWGRTESSGSSKIKRKAMLHVQPQDQCQEAFLKESKIELTDNQMCAGGEIGVDSCSGDSGGPLTVEANTPRGNRYVYLAGVVSFGRDHCGTALFSGVYTRVSSYMDWIEDTIRANRV
ncbi:serine protease easter [Drosophila elegans]|uniref:serine protease easter n=1 Tax=Drosophila elegans TaxID=30023 RepID=UPI0007E7E22F|nr:serine protease easter [Drosophila elegans]